MKQNINNLPAELIQQKRFFEVRSDKRPLIRDWNNPENQVYAKDVPISEKICAGFDINGREQNPSYLVVDFDHVLDAEGNFSNKKAEKWYNFLADADTYFEKSISGRGLHAVFAPPANSIQSIQGRLDCGNGAFIEVFYKTGGRFFLFTGAVYNCAEKTPITRDISHVQTLIEEIEKHKPKSSPARVQIEDREYENARIKAMFDSIEVFRMPYSEWLAFMSACKNCGIDYSDVDAKNKRDAARYNSKENFTSWHSLNDSSFDARHLYNLAKKYGNFEDKAFRADWLKENADKTAIGKLFNDLRGFKIPFGYIVKKSGVFKLVSSSKGIKRVQISRQPFYISAKYQRLDGTYCADVVTLDPSGKIKKVQQVSMLDLSDARRITGLAETGLPFTSSNAKNIVDFLDAFQFTNAPLIIPQMLFQKLGWNNLDNKKVFVSPYSDEIPIDKNNKLKAHLKTQGKYEDWLNCAEQIFYYSVDPKGCPIGWFTLSAAFASFLLPIVGCRTFAFYICAESKSGKSALLKLISAAFGDIGYMKDFNATGNALEKSIADIAPFPPIVDEKQVAVANFDASNFVYRLAQGEGKSRCRQDGTLRETARWWCLCICAGEELLTEMGRTQGLFTRTLEAILRGKILPDDLARKCHMLVDAGISYGHAGKIFLEKIQQINFEELRQAYDELSQKFCSEFPQYNDQHCRYIAVITLASLLLLQWILNLESDAATAFSLDIAKSIFSLIGTARELSDAEKEKDIIQGWIAEDRLHFEGLIDVPKEKLVPPIFGGIKDGYLYINTKSLKDALARNGYSYSKTKADLISSGYFAKINGQDTAMIRLNKHAPSIRCLKVAEPFEHTQAEKSTYDADDDDY